MSRTKSVALALAAIVVFLLLVTVIYVASGDWQHRPSSAFAPKGHRRVTDIVSFGSTNAGNADRLVDRLPAQGQCFRPWRCFIGGNTCGLACKMTGREEWLERRSMAAT